MKTVYKEKYKLSLMIILYMFTICVFYNFFKILKIVDCIVLIEILGIIVPIIYYFLLSKKVSNIKKIITISIYLILILITPFIFSKTYDVSADGNSYHKTSIGLMSEGWNPIYESSGNFNSSISTKIEDIDIWIDHYPKASYFIGVCMYSLTNNIESGKCITFLANISLVLLTISILEEKLSKKKAYIIGILIGLNPIVLSQILTFYIDGLMGILFGIELLLLSITNPKSKKINSVFIYLLSCCGIFVNLKFTGLLFSGIIAAVYYFYWLYKYRKDNDKWTIYKNITIKFSIIFIIAIVVIGSSSYIKNTIDHKNPLYPLFGENKVDIITTMQPTNYKDKNGLEKFINSLFSKTENVLYNSDKPKLKNPLTISKTELDSLTIPDIRIGGFGPYFAITIIVTVFTLLFLLKKLIIKSKKQNNTNIHLLLSTIAIILSIILVGEGWWARYIPQLYYLVIISIIYTYLNLNKNKLNNILNALIILLLFFNSSLFVYKQNDMYKIYDSIDNDIYYLQNNKTELKLTNKNFYGIYYNLKDNKIDYVINNKLQEKEITYKYTWIIQVKEI